MPSSLIETWEAYAAHLSAIVREAKEKGAELLLLPEYSAMALTGQLPPAARSDLHRSIEEIQPLIPSWVELCEELARQHQILFQPGSAPVKDPDDKFRNRAWLFGPDGLIGYQDKQIMTRFEREQWNIHAGVEGLKAFETPIGKLGILICYDNEFPMLGRRLAELGVELVLAPAAPTRWQVPIECGLVRRLGHWKTNMPSSPLPPRARPLGLLPLMKIAAAPHFMCLRITACRHPASSRKARVMR